MKCKTLITLFIASLGAMLSSSAFALVSYTWDVMPVGGGGFVSAIVPSKTEQGLMYARTDVGGAYRWDKKNSRWVALNDNVSENDVGILGVDSLAIDQQAPNKVYLLTGFSYLNNGKTLVLRSDDYGQTFKTIDVTAQFKTHGNGMGRQNGERLQVDPNDGNILYVGTRWNGLFKSTDAGASWNRLTGLDITTTPNENGISFVVLDTNNSATKKNQKMFVGISRYSNVGANLYSSDNAGASFKEIVGGPENLMPQRAVFAGDNLLITYANGAGPHGHWIATLNEPMDQGQVWKYNTKTSVWTNITPSGFTRAFGGISVDAKNSQRIIASSINTYQLQYDNVYGDRIFLSNDGGASWVDVVQRGFVLDTKNVSWLKGNSIHWAGSIEFDPFDSKSVLVTSGNGVFKTDNIDAVPTTWAFTVAGMEETVPLNLVSIVNGPIISVLADIDGFRHTDPSQYAPMHNPRAGSTWGLDVAAKKTNLVVRVSEKKGIYYSTDMGASWTETASIKVKGGYAALSADGKILLHSPHDVNVSYRSTDWGTTWTDIKGLDVKSAIPVADSVDKKKFYALNGDRMMVSRDGGVSFKPAGVLSSADGSKVIRVAPGKKGDIWVALNNGGLARSINFGASFTAINKVTYAAAVGFGKAATSTSYPTVFMWGTVNNVTGMYRSTNIGETWERINDDNHQYGGLGPGEFVVGDMNNFGVVYMATVGRGIAFGTPSPVSITNSLGEK